MKHLEEGQLRAFYDGALDALERERVGQHLTACTRCAQTAAEVQARGARVRTLLDSMEAQPARMPVAPQVARDRLSVYLARKKEIAMRQNVFSRRYRPAWVAAALILAFAVSFAFAPVRTLAGNLLSLFRVQKIEFVEVDPANLSDEDALEEAMRKFETVMEDQISIEVDGESQVVDEATARSSAGFSVRLPAALEDEPQITLRPGLHAAMQIDLPHVRALLAELGYDDVELPDSLDGAEISIDFETTVAATYGACEPVGAEAKCTEFAQMPAPQVSAPSELDVDQLGRAYLQLLGLSAKEAARFSQRVDWTTTLVVPLPSSANLGYRDVSVDGVTGTLVRPPSYSRYAEEYVLTWIKDGVVYALHGTGSTEEALEIAGSLQ